MKMMLEEWQARVKFEYNKLNLWYDYFHVFLTDIVCTVFFFKYVLYMRVCVFYKETKIIKNTVNNYKL